MADFKGFASLFQPENRDKLANLSQFLLGFGQGTMQANQAGQSPFASLAYGFGAGGQGMQRGMDRRDQLAMRKQLFDMKVAEAEDKAAVRGRENAFVDAITRRGAASDATPGLRVPVEGFPEHRPSDRDVRVAGMAAYPQQTMQAMLKPAAKPSAREIKIGQLIDRGVDRKTAQDIADGLIRPQTDAMGNTFAVNLRTKEKLPLTGEIGAQIGGQPPAPTEPPSVIPEDVDLNAATGTTGALGNFGNTIAGFFGAQPFASVEKAGQALINLKTRTVTTLGAPIEGRNTNVLMEKMGNYTVEPYSFLQGDARSAERIGQTRDMIKGEISRIQTDILDKPGSYLPKAVSAARSNMSMLKSLLRDYDVALKGFTGKYDRPKTSAPAGAGEWWAEEID